MGVSSIIRDIGAVIGKLGFGCLGFSTFGLVYGYMISQLLYFLIILSPFITDLRFKSIARYSYLKTM